MSEQAGTAGTWLDRMDASFAEATPPTTDPDTPDPAPPVTDDPVPPTDALPAETAAPAATDAAPDTSADPATPASPPGDSPPAAPASAAPPPAKPFTFRVDGTDIAPKGAMVQPDGTITFTPEAFRHLQQHNLGDRGVWREKDRQAQQALQTERQVKNTLLERVQAVFGASDEEILNKIDEFRKNAPVLMVELAAQADRERLKQIDEERAAAEAERAWQEAEPQWRAGLVPQIQQITAELGATGLNAEQLAEELWSLKDEGLIVRAPTDLPDIGIKQGDPVYNLKLLRRELTRAKAVEDRIQKERAAALQTAAMQKRNAATLTPKVAVPPVPGAAIPTPVSANGAGTTAQQRWQAFKDSDEL